MTATTLTEQIVIRPSILTDAEKAERGIVANTVLSAKVGRSGTERHAIHVTVWEAQPERWNDYTGKMMPARPRSWNGSRTYCGSQRFGSGAHSYSDTAPVTCERCLGSGYSLSAEVMPLDVLEPDRVRYYRPR